MLGNDPLAGTSRPKYLSSVVESQMSAAAGTSVQPISAAVSVEITTNSLGDRVRTAAGAVDNSVAFIKSAVASATADKSKEPLPGWSSSSLTLAPLPESWFNHGKDFHRKMRKTLNVVSDIIAIVDALYQVIDALQSDINNWYTLLKAILVELLKQLQEIIISLSSTGIYMLPVLPDFKRGAKGVVRPGGFNAVLSKVKQKLTDPADPNRPTFSDKDAVGGVLAVITAGTNVGDLINDINALGAFIKGFLVDGPGVGSFTAIPGLYLNKVKVSMPPGVRLTWKPPVGVYRADKFLLKRSQYIGGTTVKDKIPGTEEYQVRVDVNGNPVKLYVDSTFNGGKPVVLKASRLSDMVYTDFDVEQGKTYEYQIVPVIGGVQQEGMSALAQATVDVCIPDTVFSEFLETPDGLRVGPNMGEKPDWQNQSLKELIGPALNEMFKSLVRLIGTVASITDTSSDAFADLLELMKKWVTKLKELLEKIGAVLDSLDKLKFSSGAAILRIDPDFSKGGGITRLSKLIDSATMSEAMKEDMVANSGLCSVAAAVFIVVGVPSPETFKSFGVPDDLAQSLKEAGHMGATKDSAKKAWEMISSMFGSQSSGKSAQGSAA